MALDFPRVERWNGRYGGEWEIHFPLGQGQSWKGGKGALLKSLSICLDPVARGLVHRSKLRGGDGGISFSYPILESFLPLLGFSGFEGGRRRAQRLVGYWVQEDAKVVRYSISWARKKIRKGKAADARNLSF